MGSLLFLSKNAPSPRFRLNLFAKYNVYTGKLLPGDKTLERLRKLDNLLLGKEVENHKILDSENAVSISDVS